MSQEGQLDLLLSDRFSKVSARDLGAARPAIEKLHGPFLADRVTPHSAAAVDIRAARCGHVAIGTFSFGRTVDITPNGLADAIIVTTAIKGRAGIEVGGISFGMDAGETVIVHDEDHPVFLYQPDTEVLKLRFHRSRLEDFYARTSGSGVASRSRLRFDTAMSDPDAAARWIALLRFMVATMNASVRRVPSMLELASIEEMLMLTLLNSQPHNHASVPARLADDGAAIPFARALRYVEQQLANDIALADIAKAAYCSPRTLARVFKQAGEVSPMQYVHKLRLERVRADLLSPLARGQNVAEIAFAWGYRHLGEFNRQYRAAFGETPSQTRDGALAQLSEVISPGAAR
jgi:AraC-like DNA-binding protein